MTWSVFDDGAPQHPKAMAAGNEAWGLWVAAVMHCNRYHTDGFVTLAALANQCLPVPISPAKARRLADRLCSARSRPDGAGLFEPAGKDAWNVHDFLDWNKSKAEVEAKRAADRARKKPGNGSGGVQEPPGIPPKLQPDSARNSNGKKDGENPDSTSRARERAGAPPSPPSLSGPPSPPEGGSGGLAERLVDRGDTENGEPRPRLDELREQVQFSRWFPSQRMLDWARTSGLSDQHLDDALSDARDKLTGRHDFEGWDRRVLGFIRTAIARYGKPPPDAAAEERQRKLDEAWARRQAERDREAREALERDGIEPGEPGDVRQLLKGVGGT